MHVSTVSRVLNDRAAAGRITQDTERRIRDVAQRLGYRPNTIARALRFMSATSEARVEQPVTQVAAVAEAAAPSGVVV